MNLKKKSRIKFIVLMFLTVAAVLPYVSPLLADGISNNGDKLDLTSLTRACVEVTDAPHQKMVFLQ